MNTSAPMDCLFPYKCVGIIYGAGDYPRKVLEGCLKKKLKCCAALLGGSETSCIEVSETSKVLPNDSTTTDLLRSVPKIHVKLGKIGAVIDFFRSQNVDAVVFAGAVKRPAISELSLDSKGASWLLKLGRSAFAGDDVLLGAIAKLLRQEGFAVISGTDLLDDTFLDKGVFSKIKPTKQDRDDIMKGLWLAKTIGSLDIGQSVIVCNGDILGIECVEGTDELIKRCAKLRKQQSGGILVKVSKPQQDQRLDLPTVGSRTLQNLHENGFKGLAIESLRCIVLDREKFIKTAEEFSMLLVGV